MDGWLVFVVVVVGSFVRCGGRLGVCGRARCRFVRQGIPRGGKKEVLEAGRQKLSSFEPVLRCYRSTHTVFPRSQSIEGTRGDNCSLRENNSSVRCKFRREGSSSRNLYSTCVVSRSIPEFSTDHGVSLVGSNPLVAVVGCRVILRGGCRRSSSLAALPGCCLLGVSTFLDTGQDASRKRSRG